jgi:hypothetical protein
MRKIKWNLLLIAAFGITAAYTSKPAPSPSTLHEYSFSFYSTDHSRIYYGMDLTAANWVQGIDYDCQLPAIGCTFVGDTNLSHSDLTGNYFYVSQIPVSGINSEGTFIELD